MTRGFHSLAGIGGTYGFPHITDLAIIGELTCESVRLPLIGMEARMIRDVIDSLDRANHLADQERTRSDHGHGAAEPQPDRGIPTVAPPSAEAPRAQVDRPPKSPLF